MDDTFPSSVSLHFLSFIPFSHYLFLLLLFLLLVFLYRFLEIHFLRSFLTAFRGDPVSLTYHPRSQVYQSVAAKCHVLRARFLPTFWLSSPHLQTAFLSLFGKSPHFSYQRRLFHTPDGGTIALDWLMHFDVKKGASYIEDTTHQTSKAPILIVIPGLTSDSASAYIKHLAFNMASQGWNVVVSNHRGLGGVSITSDCFYNAGWTEDIRKVVEHIHCQYPEAPLYAVGTSIGANILVKFLGEDVSNTPLIGAAAICCPWDLLICDRFINRKLVQKFYGRVLTIGLQGYAQLHQSVLSRLVEWNDVRKSRSVRDFDNYATRVLGKFETVDTYYRRSSCVNFMGNVSVPLLCISALDDPVCTREAIPWDECRLNENIVLATTQHGGHLAYYEGITANSMWWVRAVTEFLNVLHSSPLRNKRQKIEEPRLRTPLESSIDEGPLVNVVEDGIVSTIGDRQRDVVEETETPNKDKNEKGTFSSKETCAGITEGKECDVKSNQEMDRNLDVLIGPLKTRIDQLSRHSRKSLWLLAYIAIMTTWPVIGSALILFLKRKFKKMTPSASVTR